MGSILAVTTPFFALILLGWLAAWRGALPANAIPGLNTFVLFFALPCMLLRFGQQTPLIELLSPSILGVYLSSAVLIVALAVALARARSIDSTNAAFGALVAAFPNSGFIGVPLLVALLGQRAAGPVICSMLADMIFTSSLCLALARKNEVGQGQAVGRESAWRPGLRRALSNPLPWAIALGGFLGAVGWTLPGPLARVVGMLADAASPVALFTIGAVLWRAMPHPPADADPSWFHRFSHAARPFGAALPVAAIKLLLHPALVYGLGRGAQALGAPLESAQLTALTLCAALPSASNVSLLAERYGADNGLVARIILLSTLLAFASFTLLAWRMAPR
jgi:predicted permease